ncbi:hypothetical protein PLICRDRAFT_99881 [Plicaturopsis crispa FD-325 SS-3]|nr:hypothetical protein PLICRDRAFT_99881 [Plicaturopsis crispa FD-325 SS-3]
MSLSSVPRWKTALSKSLADNPSSNLIQLATLDAQSSIHVRTHVLRSFLPSKSPANPLLITSTDIRTPKCAHIVAHPHVEFAWWIAPTAEQFRIAGRATLIPAPAHPYANRDAYPEPDGFEWEAKRRETFNAMGGHMRASWARPVPGSPLSAATDPHTWPTTLPELGDPGASEQERRDTEVAFENFALVVIEPQEVDYAELGEVPNRRTRFVKKGEEWDEEALVP